MTINQAHWWDKAFHGDRRGLLLARNRIKAALRAWFEAEGFIEVEPACLQASPGNETHLHAFATEAVSEAGARAPLYLHTSPEFAMKKLLAAGEEKIFAFATAFRNREQARSALHAREFCLLEWYRAGADALGAVMADATAIARVAAEAAGAELLRWRGATCAPGLAPEALSVREAFAREGVDLAASLTETGAGDRTNLARQLAAQGLRIGADEDWSDLFSRFLVERIEPKLGQGRLTLLHRYPAPEAALAVASREDPRFAERFELYACGVELANGFEELTDAAEQRARFEQAMAQKARRYGERYPIDEDFLAALTQMPPAAGCALGFDRLVLLALGAPRIQDVLWTPG